jgi:hypothetical protein
MSLRIGILAFYMLNNPDELQDAQRPEGLQPKAERLASRDYFCSSSKVYK